MEIRAQPKGGAYGENKSISQLVTALKKCSDMKNLECGKNLHEDARRLNMETNMHVGSSLISMYSNCKRISLAQQVFEKLTNHDVIVWNALILGYADNGESFKALDLFTGINCKPSSATYVAALQACKGLDVEKEFRLGKAVDIHKQAKEHGFDTSLLVSNALVDIYAKSGSMKHSWKVFEGMTDRSVVTWNSLILGYVENGESLVALELFSCMDCRSSPVTYIAAFKGCGALAAMNKEFFLEKGVTIHKQAQGDGSGVTIAMTTSLMEMYSKCGSMFHARECFEKMVDKDVVAWNTLVIAYVENGDPLQALELFTFMDCKPTAVTFVCVLKALGSLASRNESMKKFCLEKTRMLQRQVKDSMNVVASTALLDVHCKCGDMRGAVEVFLEMNHRNTVTWTSLISGYVENGEIDVALDLFACMDCEPDCFTFSSVFKAFGALANSEQVKKLFFLEKAIVIHKQAQRRGFQSETVLAATLVEMYSNLGFLNHARRVLDGMAHRNAAAWQALLIGYIEKDEGMVAMELFRVMDCRPSLPSYTTMLKTCGSLSCRKEYEKQFWLETGIGIHKEVQRSELDSDILISTSLIDMYRKCGSLSHARRVFAVMSYKDVVTWTSLMLGYVEQGQSNEALELFIGMDVEPDSFTYVVALKASGSTGALDLGKTIHASICKHGMEQDRVVLNALMVFYGKCGRMSSVEVLFNQLGEADIVSWNVLVAGYSSLGKAAEVFSLIRTMQDAEVHMNEVTLISILAVCSHAGLVQEGKQYFDSMISRHGVLLSLEHYNCLIDILSRNSRLEEARLIVNTMPFKANNVTWKTLLSQHIC